MAEKSSNRTRSIETTEDVELEGGKLKREWGFWSILGFATTSLGTWESVGGFIGPAFTDGGPVAVVYGFICAAIGVSLIFASLAEMASILPIAGAQYHWTAMFAPPKWRRFLSYLQGWITIWAWQFAIATSTFIACTLITGVVTLNHPSYTSQPWHICLMMIAFCIFQCALNIYAKTLLPIIETISGICHVVFFFIIVTTVLVLGKKQPSSFVWTDFEHNGGWRSDAVTFCLGFLAPSLGLAGADGCVHLAEECRKPTVDIPRALLGSVMINAALGFGFILVLLYCVTDVTAAIESPTGYPLIAILYQASASVAGATVMTSMTVLVITFGTAALLAGTSRLVWAFARDKGLPFSNFFAHVHPKIHAPIRTLLLTITVTILLSLIVLGSTTAFFALLSLTTIAIYTSYTIPILAFLYYRITHGDNVHYGPWRLGRFGIPINIAAILFALFLIAFMPLPSVLPVTAANFNYAGPLFGVVVVGSGVDWYFRGRKVYVGPDVAAILLERSGEATASEVEET